MMEKLDPLTTQRVHILVGFVMATSSGDWARVDKRHPTHERKDALSGKNKKNTALCGVRPSEDYMLCAPWYVAGSSPRQKTRRPKTVLHLPPNILSQQSRIIMICEHRRGRG